MADRPHARLHLPGAAALSAGRSRARALALGGLALGFALSAAAGPATDVPPPTPAPATPGLPAGSPLALLGFLVGTWSGEGAGRPGHGVGSFTFAPDLDGRVLVRRSRTAYPAASGRPASVHDDLMVVYPAPGGHGLEAVYFDNEGHVIEYEAAISADGGRIVLTSEAEPATPTFRLTYERVDAGTVDVTFEYAPPGKPGAFVTYVRGRARRAATE